MSRKTRMSNARRDVLNAFVIEKVLPEERYIKDFVATYMVTAKYVKDTLENKYPKSDIEVLKKYKAASVDNCIKFKYGESGARVFYFKSMEYSKSTYSRFAFRISSSGYPYSGGYIDKELTEKLACMDGPIIPNSEHTGSQKVHDLGLVMNTYYDQLIKQADDYDKRKEEVRKPYYDVIRSVMYVEDVFDIWPEASAISSQLIPNLIANVPSINVEDTKTLIAADMLRRGVKST